MTYHTPRDNYSKLQIPNLEKNSSQNLSAILQCGHLHRTVYYILLKLVDLLLLGEICSTEVIAALLLKVILSHLSGQAACYSLAVRNDFQSACKRQLLYVLHFTQAYTPLSPKKRTRSSTAYTAFSGAQLQQVQISPKYNFIGHPVLVIEVKNSRSSLVSLREAALWRLSLCCKISD